MPREALDEPAVLRPNLPHGRVCTVVQVVEELGSRGGTLPGAPSPSPLLPKPSQDLPIRAASPLGLPAGVEAEWAAYFLGHVLCCLQEALHGLLGLVQPRPQGLLGRKPTRAIMTLMAFSPGVEQFAKLPKILFYK